MTRSWNQAFLSLKRPSVRNMLLLGFAAGMPILLIFSSLSLWLREAGLSKSEVTYFSWAALGYSFKFIWAPIVDCFPLPILQKLLGRRKSWLFLAQALIVFALLGMALTDPAQGEAALKIMALSAVLLGFSSATQDIVVDAYRIECDDKDMQATLSSAYIIGYRVAMILAGAGAIAFAQQMGSTAESYSYNAWKLTYLLMAGVMGLAMILSLKLPEPTVYKKSTELKYGSKDYLKFFGCFVILVSAFIFAFNEISTFSAELKESLAGALGNSLASFASEATRLIGSIACAAFAALVLVKIKFINSSMLKETYLDPVIEFFKRFGVRTAWLLLALVGFYRISDIVLGVISNVFYADIGFSKMQIAGVVKTFGLAMTLVGGFLGGLLSTRFGVMKILFLGAVLSSVTNLFFMLLNETGQSMALFYFVISIDNLAAGLASAAFIAFLSSLVNVRFTAIQYAIFSSFMTLLPKTIGGYSGSIVENMGYSNFFLLTALMGVPVLFLIVLAGKHLKLKD